MSNARHPDFDTWVPSAARQKITELRQRPGFSSKEAALLNRLAKCLLMKTEVWAKLPHKPVAMEGQIISLTFVGAQIAAALPPPPPRKRSELLEYSQYLTVPTFLGAAVLADALLERMKETRSDLLDAVMHDPESERGFGMALKTVEQIGELYRLAYAGRKELIAAAKFPQVRKKGSKRAPEVLFSRFMSAQLQKLYRRPLDTVVAALTGVVFPNAQKTVGSDTIRDRRRRSPGRDIRTK